MEKLLDYNPSITFVPPIAIRKALRHIPHRHILHSDVQVVSVFIGRVEFDKPLVLYTGYERLEVSRKRPMPVMKR